MYKLICLFVCIAMVYGDVGPGRNEYLPPQKGYNYDRPNVPFPSNPQPTQVPYPTQSRPVQTRPVQPSYVPSPVTRPYPTQQTNYPTGPTVSHEHHHEDHHHHEPGMPFDFQYSVNDVESANDYAHKAVSDGDVTRGEYRVQLPDGRTQIVRYTADWKNGYNAEVTYEGTAQYPEGPFGQPSNSINEGYKY